MATSFDSLDVKTAPMAGFPGYQALSDGGIIGPRGKLLKAHNGQISVSIGGKKMTANIAPLIWGAFNGAPPEGGITFRDGDRLNPALRNLVPCHGSYKPVRHCRKGHLLTPDECAVWASGNRVCRRCNPDLPTIMPIVQSWSAAYGTGRAPD